MTTPDILDDTNSSIEVEKIILTIPFEIALTVSYANAS